MITVSGALDTELLTQLGWTPKYEGIWPLRGRLTGYRNSKRSSVRDEFHVGTPIPGVWDILLAHLEVERLYDSRRSESSFNRSSDSERAYIWLCDTKIKENPDTPYFLDAGHPLFEFHCYKEGCSYKQISLDHLELFDFSKMSWYPGRKNLDYRYHTRIPWDTHRVENQRAERYREALRVLIH